MKKRRPEHEVTGPAVAEVGDIAALNRLFADAFTERYRRDGLVGVRVPPLNPAIWTYAIRDAAGGALMWRDAAGELVAFNVAHRSGEEGWMGPLAVRPNRQGTGLGRLIVETAIQRLRSQRVTTLGLETMPRTVENIGFYGKLGFLPGHLTITVTGDSTERSLKRGLVRLSALSQADRDELLAACRRRLDRSAPGADYSSEIMLTIELGLGDALCIERSGGVEAFALWHAAPLVDQRNAEEVRVLKLFAGSPAAFLEVARGVEACAAAAGLNRVAVRCQTRFIAAYEALLKRGYTVRWTDLRMTLAGYPEPELPPGEVLFSNWEI
jgi:GNAT superfamily N-acetyltransferase